MLAAGSSLVRTVADGQSDFGAYYHLLAPSQFAHPAPDDLLAHAQRIDVGGIEEVDSVFDCLGEIFPRFVLFQHPGAPALAAVVHASQGDA